MDTPLTPSCAAVECKRHDWYLAGPMTGYPELNFPLFRAETARLRSLGYSVINPAEVNVDPAKGWVECMRADIPELLKCEGIALLPRWSQSKGASLELHIASELGMQIRNASDITAPKEA